jgi:hypothetical protein
MRELLPFINGPTNLKHNPQISTLKTSNIAPQNPQISPLKHIQPHSSNIATQNTLLKTHSPNIAPMKTSLYDIDMRQLKKRKTFGMT